MQLSDSLAIAAAGMKAQGDRLRVIAENLANADSTGTKPGEEPYRRKLVVFKNMLDEASGLQTVQVARRMEDQSPFGLKYAPFHPAANDQGYIQTPNVSSVMEMVDMREARRSYEANLSVVEMTRNLLNRTLDLLR